MTLILYIKKPFERTANNGRDPLNQTFRKFRSKTQCIGSVRSNRKSFEKTGPPFEVDQFSRSDRLEFWLNGSRPLNTLPQKLKNHCITSNLLLDHSSCFCPSSNSLFGHLCFHPCPRLSSSPTYEHMR